MRLLLLLLPLLFLLILLTLAAAAPAAAAIAPAAAGGLATCSMVGVVGLRALTCIIHALCGSCAATCLFFHIGRAVDAYKCTSGPGHPLPRQRLDRVATVCAFALV